MAKSLPKKKKNYRLKKTVRRSIAAVFMITAIVLAAIPVPDAAADELFGTDTLSGNTPGTTSIKYPEESEIVIQPTKYAKPVGVTPFKTYEIQKNNDGSYKKIWVYEIWLDSSIGIDKGVICNFNSEYNPEGGSLTIPNNVITEYKSFTMEDRLDENNQTIEGVESAVRGYGTNNMINEVNAFFGIVPIKNPDNPDDPNLVLPAAHYKFENNKWIDPKTLLEITGDQKRSLYMWLSLDPKLGKDFTAREVITGTGAGGNTYEYIPFGPSGYEKKTEYEINAIGDNAFYDGSAKANHIQNLKLQIVDSVIAIGNEAFRGAATLQEVTIGANVKDIGARAFKECTALNTVTINAGNKTVGIEAFSGCNTLPEIHFASTFEKVGMGAFSNCINLKTADMSKSTISGVVVDKFAFYNCPNLKNVSFAPNTETIGDGCFAVISTMDSLEEIILPQSSQTLKILGNGMFDGQNRLKKVTMPLSFGSAVADDMVSILDSGFFFKCSNLETLIFPDNCVYASFPDDIFRTVENPNFKVVGPATLSLNDATYARPRTSAHAAGVPYQYVENGVTYLELKKGDDFYRIDENNQLISFESVSSVIDLEIFDKVGNFPITSIKNGCFTQEIKDKLNSVTIYDNSITEIDAETFSNCPILQKVSIGNSVASIGDRAFLTCPKLEKITLAAPSAGYDTMTIGADAFKTESKKLTLQGDIVKGYAPFTWAMDEASVLDQYGTRVCYKSNAPQNLTVIRDNITGLATLVDYPHFEDVDVDNADYKERITKYYQGTVSDLDTKNQIAEIVAESYYIENKLRTSMGELPVEGSTWTPDASLPWYKVTTEEQQLYDSIINVVVPAGVESIDSRTFYDPASNTSVGSNEYNWVYIDSIKRDKYSTFEEDDEPLPAIHGGLFSGKFTEFPPLSEKEKYAIGNDRLQSVTMYDVKALPDYAFESCENLVRVTLGSGMQRMGMTPFAGCLSLTDVEGNQNYTVANKIVYSNNAGGSKNIVQCLPIRGLKSMDEKELSVQSDPMIAQVSSVSPAAFKDCAGIAELDFTAASKWASVPKDCFNNCSELVQVKLPESVRSISDGAFKNANPALTVTIPTKQISITDNAFEHNQGKIITYPDSAAWSYAELWNIRRSPLGEKYKVTFVDNVGKVIDVQMIEAGENAEPPVPPIVKGYVFKEWSGSYKNITEDVTLIALYEPESGDPSNPSKPSGSGSGSPNPSGSGSPNPSGSGSQSKTSENDSTKKYKVTITSGSGSGDYTAGTIINITANASADKKIFDKWTTSSAGTYLANSGNVTTSFVMPKNDVAITATYKTATVSENKTTSGNKTPSTSGNNVNRPNNGSNSTSTKKGTVITITKPGFSNTDKANAIVNGSTDNFIVKVTESAEAQAAIQEALLNDNLTMDTIKYFPMDISLYDSTGTVLVTDTEGISVNITMPLPDELVQYAGNNKVASVTDGILEDLRPKFSTIDKVPCVTFTATHFSPYTIYVDTAHLVAGETQDSNPKTGDGIHPKWFLVIGLMAISTVLFIKKDKREHVALG